MFVGRNTVIAVRLAERADGNTGILSSSGATVLGGLHEKRVAGIESGQVVIRGVFLCRMCVSVCY